MPTPDQIRSARATAGLSQAQAAKLVGIKRLSWSACEIGASRMSEQTWRLFLILTKQAKVPRFPPSA